MTIGAVLIRKPRAKAYFKSVLYLHEAAPPMEKRTFERLLRLLWVMARGAVRQIGSECGEGRKP